MGASDASGKPSAAVENRDSDPDLGIVQIAIANQWSGLGNLSA
jgi:hypothetical protein